MSKEFFWGFTLAEILIAVAIVGIIAALTIPGVVSNYNQKALITQLQKNYIELQEALLILKTENYHRGLDGSILNKKGSKTVANTAGRFLREYYKILDDCGSDTQPCFADKYADINSLTDTDFSCADGYSVTVASGAAICIIPAEITDDDVVDPNTGAPTLKDIDNPAVVYIDVNGTEGPNIGGRDMFTYSIWQDFSIDEINPADPELDDLEEARETLFTNNCRTSNVGRGCFGKILNDNWKLNY